MEPTQELTDSIYIEKVMRARRTPIEDKVFEGARLFAYACEIARGGIQSDNPGATPARIEELLRQRLEIGRLLEAKRNGEDEIT